MSIISKIKIHFRDIERNRSARFVFDCFFQIIDRRISLSKYFSFIIGESDEIMFEKYLNPSEKLVVVDIGANLGELTLRYSKKYKAVHAFEPNPNTFSLLRRNTRKCKNVILYCCALGEKDSISDFFMHKTHVLDGFVSKRDNFIKTVKIRIKTLDSFNLDADLIKIDTEGYELPILMGAQKTLENKRPQLYIELHEKEQEAPICELLKKVGYKYSIFSVRNNIQKFIITDYTSAGM